MDDQSDNLFLIGFMGVGKSTVAQALCRDRGAVLVEMDQVIADQQDMEIPDIFGEYGENYFRKLETDLLLELKKKTGQVVSCGGGVVLREKNIEIMKSCGQVVLLTAGARTVYDRVKSNKNRPLLNNEMSVDHIKDLMRERRDLYWDAADIAVSTEGKSVHEIVSEISRKLENH